MNQEVHPVAQFIADHGGTVKIARALGTNTGTVRMWRKRKRLPRARWIDLSRALDVSLGELAALDRAA